MVRNKLSPYRSRRLEVMKPINVVVTCTKRKRLVPADGLKVRDIPADHLDGAFEEWRRRLERSDSETLAARHLYAGDHWSVVQSLEKEAYAFGIEPTIWVCSAGYGLIAIDTAIKPYSATFSANHQDTVCRWRTLGQTHGRNGLAWWDRLQQWTGPDPELPRSISQVAKSSPELPLLVVASNNYIKAIGQDLKQAAGYLADPDLLSLISTGTKSLRGLDANLILSSSSLQQALGGSLISLNVRLARAILSEVPYANLRAPALRAKVGRLVEASLPVTAVVRGRMSDQEVRRYIETSLKKDPLISWSALLRRLRHSGKACRQERFSQLFKSVTSGSDLDQ